MHFTWKCVCQYSHLGHSRKTFRTEQSHKHRRLSRASGTNNKIDRAFLEFDLFFNAKDKVTAASAGRHCAVVVLAPSERGLADTDDRWLHIGGRNNTFFFSVAQFVLELVDEFRLKTMFSTILITADKEKD